MANRPVKSPSPSPQTISLHKLSDIAFHPGGPYNGILSSLPFSSRFNPIFILARVSLRATTVDMRPRAATSLRMLVHID